MRFVAVSCLGSLALAACQSPGTSPPPRADSPADAHEPTPAVISVYFATQPPVHWAYPDLAAVELKGPDGSLSRPRLDEEVHRQVLFDVTGPGPFTLRVADPHFEPIELSGLEPGSSKTVARLVGSAALHLRVFDAATGEDLADWSAALVLANSSYPSASEPWDAALVWTRPEMQGPHGRANDFELRNSGSDGWFRGIAPADYTVVVRADDSAPSFASCPSLAAGETREIAVPLWRPGSIEGVVEGAVPIEAPFGQIPIEVYAFAIGDDSAPGAGITFAKSYVPPKLYLGLGRARSTCKLGDDGRSFRLEGLAPGAYVVQARQRGAKPPIEPGTNPWIDVFSRCSAVVVTPEGISRVVVRWEAD